MSTDIRVQLAEALKDHEDLSSPTRLDSLATVHRLRPIVARMDREAGMSGRFAHRVQRAAARKVETEQIAADAAKHPRKGWTVMGTRDVYRVTVIEPAPRPDRPSIPFARKRKGVGGTIVGGVTDGQNLPGAKAPDAVTSRTASLQKDSGALILRAQAAIDSGRKNGLGELRLECKQMGILVNASNPNASALLEKMERALRVAQYELSQYS